MTLYNYASRKTDYLRNSKIMRATIPLMVKPRRPVRKVPPLLPPLQLYRRILRGHRKYLPELQRSLGDQYVKAEFHAHKDIDNPLHIVGFLTSWQDYLNAISGNSWREAGLTQQDLDKMSPQQVGQVGF